MEQIEVVEMAGLAVARRGRLDEARQMATTAVALAEKIPNVMLERLRRLQAATALAPPAVAGAL
jgi:hypothetical protein